MAIMDCIMLPITCGGDGQPVSFDKVPDFEDYGLGCFLLAGSEVYKL